MAKKKSVRKTFIRTLLFSLLLIFPIVFSVTVLYEGASLPDTVINNVLGITVDPPHFETFTYSISQDVPENLRLKIEEGLGSVVLEDFEMDRYKRVDSDGQISFSMSAQNPEQNILLNTKMLLVGHPYWVKDDFSSEELPKWKYITLKENERAAQIILTTQIGGEGSLTTVENIDELVSFLEDSDDTVGLLQSDQLDPRLRLLSIDQKYYLENPQDGAISINLGVDADSSVPEFILETLPLHIQLSQGNVEEISTDQILSLRMTGVTALSRNLAIKMERAGDFAYPADKIGEFLAAADFTHTSNEVSFVPGCVPEQSLRFCSAPGYIATLEAAGIDIVELTGNHNNDYGSTHNGTTIDTYASNGWTYFGGGKNAEDAAKIRYIEKDGSKIALIGYNWYDTALNTLAVAGAERPGANSYSAEKVAADVKKAKENADFLIVTFQFQECYSYPESDVIYPPCYRALGSPDQKGVFRGAIDAGADLVVGTQAHQPQTYEIYKDKLIFYGLGNIFFDQVSWIGTRQGMVLTHYFIDGKHVQSKIDTTIYDGDMKPYVTYGERREQLLKLLNDAR